MPKYEGEYEHAIRPFVDAMRVKLAANRHKGKEWEKLDLEAILGRIEGEVRELREAILGGNTIEIMLEAADIGNYAMIASWVAIQKLGAHPKFTNPPATIDSWQCSCGWRGIPRYDDNLGEHFCKRCDRSLSKTGFNDGRPPPEIKVVNRRTHNDTEEMEKP